MKKLLLLVSLLLSLTASYAATPYFGEFGLKYYKDIVEYDKYVGQIVRYIPAQPTPSSDDKSFPGEFNTDYQITSIKESKNVMSITLMKIGDNKKINWKVYNGFGNSKYAFSISNYHTIPLLLVTKFDEAKEKYTEKKFTDNKITYHYDCINFDLHTYSNENGANTYPVPTCFMRNSITGEITPHPATGGDTTLTHWIFYKAHKGAYHASLIKVDKPENEAIRYGESKIIEEEGVTKYSYTDDVVRIILLANSEQFSFKLENISNNTIKLIWDEAVFVDSDGSTSKVMHEGVKYSEKSNRQAASTVIKGASLSDIAVPIKNVRYASLLKEWVTDSMFPKKDEGSPVQLKLMLPIQIKDIINEYIFVFNVEWRYDKPEYVKQ